MVERFRRYHPDKIRHTDRMTDGQIRHPNMTTDGLTDTQSDSNIPPHIYTGQGVKKKSELLPGVNLIMLPM